ncbi:hypothetical protein PTKIN_Ptkin01aG0138300 [Pterospermum kingtungense]
MDFDCSASSSDVRHSVHWEITNGVSYFDHSLHGESMANFDLNSTSASFRIVSHSDDEDVTMMASLQPRLQNPDDVLLDYREGARSSPFRNNVRLYNSMFRFTSLVVDRAIVEGLIQMLDENNKIVKAFRTTRDRFKDSNYVLMHLRLIES